MKGGGLGVKGFHGVVPNHDPVLLFTESYGAVR